MKKPVEDKGIIFYEGSDNGLRIKTFIEDDTIWLTQPQIAELFQSSRSNVAEHIKHIYEEEELRMDATCRNFRQVQIEGGREVSRDLPHYNLDMVISLGYRINSKIATTFRRWATERLKEFHVTSIDYDKNNKLTKEVKRIQGGKNEA